MISIHICMYIHMHVCKYIYIHMLECMYTYIRVHIYIYICICRCVHVYGCGSKLWFSRGSPPLLQTFVGGPLLQTLVADLCVEYCSLQGACRGGVCRRTPPSVTNLCREMAAQACYKANVFDSLPYLYIYICIYTCVHVFYVYVYVHMLLGHNIFWRPSGAIRPRVACTLMPRPSFALGTSTRACGALHPV